MTTQAAETQSSEENKGDNLNTFIETLIAADKNEDTIFTEIANKTGKGILSAVRLYKQFLKDTGRTLSIEDRKIKIKELLDPLMQVVADVNTLDIPKATTLLASELDISTQAARGNVRKFCAANKIDVPVRSVLSKEEVEKYVAFVVEGAEKGASKKDIIAKLVSEHELDEATALKVYSRIAKDNGLLAERVKHDVPAMAAFIKENINEDTTKKVFCEKVEAEFNLPASTSGKLFASWQFALVFQAA